MNSYDRLVLSRRPLVYWTVEDYLDLGMDRTTGGRDANTIVINSIRPSLLHPQQNAVMLQGGHGMYRTPTTGLGAIDNLTMEVWLKPEIIASGNQSVMNNSGAGSIGYDILIDTNFTVKGHIPGVAFLASSSQLPQYRWTHIVMTRKAGVWTYWLNGKRDVVTPGSTTPSPASGGVFGAVPDVNFQRWIGPMAFYERALDPNEILENYQAGIQQQLIHLPFAVRRRYAGGQVWVGLT